MSDAPIHVGPFGQSKAPVFCMRTLVAWDRNWPMLLRSLLRGGLLRPSSTDADARGLTLWLASAAATAAAAASCDAYVAGGRQQSYCLC